MKANELMIGDLVTFKDCQNDKALSVVKITDISALDGIWGEISGEKIRDRVGIDDLAGIPLTITFLAKNFPTPACGVSWWPNTFHPRIHCEIKKEDYGEIEVKGNFEYIHELQHALRLCGINKEIVL